MRHEALARKVHTRRLRPGQPCDDRQDLGQGCWPSEDSLYPVKVEEQAMVKEVQYSLGQQKG